MNQKLLSIAIRRERLVAQCAAQRIALLQEFEPWRAPLTLADQGLAAFRYARNHPTFMAGGMVLLSTLWPGRTGRWLRHGWVAWKVIHELRAR